MAFSKEVRATPEVWRPLTVRPLTIHFNTRFYFDVRLVLIKTIPLDDDALHTPKNARPLRLFAASLECRPLFRARARPLKRLERSAVEAAALV